MRVTAGGLPVDTVVEWGRQLADALVYLHGVGVVHRDLKPENILVTPDDRLVIADFGTAALAGARRLTWRHLSESLGTPDYMSPEQVQGSRGDARSDIYAWGVIMYELLTGRVPFQGDNWMAVMAGHLQGDPTPIRKLRPDTPAPLETWTGWTSWTQKPMTSRPRNPWAAWPQWTRPDGCGPSRR